MSEKLVIETFDPTTGIARVTFNRPQVLNAVDVAMARAIRDAVLRFSGREDMRCLVLSAKGRAFMAGGDVASLASDGKEAAEAILSALHPALLALRASDAPVLAIVQGAAAGAGFSLALGADLVLAADDARFTLAYDRIGVTPDAGGTWYLARKVTRARAFGTMLLGEELDARAAQAAGIVNEIAPLAELEAQLEAEKRAFLAGTQTADFREGVAAFIEKREPKFSGS